MNAQHDLTIGAQAHVIDEQHERFGETGEVLKLNKKTAQVQFEDGKQTIALEALELADDETEAGSKMSATLAKYRVTYVTSISASGRKSKACGDELSILCEGKDHIWVCALADLVFGEEPGTHRTKYAKLNPGQQRMNSGNRIRAAIKRGDTTIDSLKEMAGQIGQ